MGEWRGCLLDGHHFNRLYGGCEVAFVWARVGWVGVEDVRTGVGIALAFEFGAEIVQLELDGRQSVLEHLFHLDH